MDIRPRRDTVQTPHPQHGMVYPIGTESTSSSDYGITGIPHAFIVGRDGKVAWSGHPLSSAFEGAIVEALGITIGGYRHLTATFRRELQTAPRAYRQRYTGIRGH